MAQIITREDQSTVISNLDTYNHTAQSTSMYVVSASLTEIPPSSVSIVIKQNGSTKATSDAPSATQSAIKLRTILNVTSGDTLTIVISSTDPAESGANIIKGIVSFRPGTV